MRKLIPAVLILATLGFPAFAVGTASATTIGQLVPAHSHWDVRNADHELKICYTILGHSSGQGSTIAFIPLREQDSQNFMQLTITTTGFKLQRRVNGVFTTVTPSVSTALPHGTDGQEIMFDYVQQGADLYLYALNADLSRGALQYQWHDPTYPVGVNISYYTSPHWGGKWDFVHGTPLDGIGMPHDIEGLVQDARNHPSQTGASTFDDPTPAGGSVTDITNRDVATVAAGLASGPKYSYGIDVSGTGTGTFDYRDPGASGNEKFWAAGYYRLTVPSSSSSMATIKRYSASGTLVHTWTASAGGNGHYILVLDGADQGLYKDDPVNAILALTDDGPQSGVRVRVRPSTQTWSFTAAPSS